jgi:hypothetical protein
LASLRHHSRDNRQLSGLQRQVHRYLRAENAVHEHRTEKKVSPEVSFGGMLFGNAGLVDFTSRQSAPNGTFADPVQDVLYDSGPRPLVVSGELWAEVILLLEDRLCTTRIAK